MTPFKMIIPALRMKAATVFSSWSNSFAGAQESGTRTSTVSMPTDTRKEITFRTRLELVKKSRWISNNLGLFRRFINGTARYSIGNGIVHIPDTTDLTWNDLADSYFNNWASNEIICDVRGRVTFWRMQKYLLRAMVRDGDAFALKVGPGIQTLASGKQVPVLPQLQWLESTAIANKLNFSSTMTGIDEEGFRDGVKSTPSGKAIAYSMLVDRDPKMWDQYDRIIIPADAIRHLFDAERATSMRGLPWGYHGMNSALDILDLMALEKHAVKIHSAMAAAIKRRGGDARNGFGSDLRRDVTTDAAGKKKVVTYQDFLSGAGILQLDLDEEFQLLTSNRPATTFAGFIDFLVRDMAWGYGVPPEFIWSVAGLGGPNSRVILEDAKWFFEEIQDLMVDLLCRPIYTWVISRGMLRGELPKCQDPRWWSCHWQGPAKITIDQGKEGMLEQQRLATGCGTWEEFWGARGKNGKKQVHRRIDEIKDAMDYAKKQTVPFEYVMQMKPGTPTSGGGSGSGGAVDGQADS